MGAGGWKEKILGTHCKSSKYRQGPTLGSCSNSFRCEELSPSTQLYRTLIWSCELKKDTHTQKAENMKTPFYTSFFGVYCKLHINSLGIRSISHPATKPTAFCPGLVLGPDFASPCFVRAKYQAELKVDW